MTETLSEAKAPPRSAGMAIAAMIIAMALATLDNVIVSTAMPTILDELGGLDQLAWVVTAYTLGVAAASPIWGKLGDMYGRRGVFLTTIALFVLGSVLCGLAQDMGQLIAFRVVQGIGGGGLLVGTVAILVDLIPPLEMGKWQAVMSAVMGGAMISGPLAGGFLTDTFGWRWCFLVNVPLGALAFVMIAVALRLPSRPRRGRIDYAGAGLLVVVIVALVLVATWAGTKYSWHSPITLGLLALAAVTGVAFYLTERRAREPVLPLEVFRSTNFTLITVIGFLVGCALFAALTFLPVFVQAVQGASATSSGLLLLPVLLPMVLVNVVVGRIVARTGKYRAQAILGGALMVVGLLLMSTMDTETSRVTSAVFMSFFGVGLGFLLPTTVLVALNSVSPDHTGVASSSVNLFRIIGGTFGVSAMGAVFASRVQEVVTTGDTYRQAVASGASWVFLLTAAVSFAGFAAAWFIRETPLTRIADAAR